MEYFFFKSVEAINKVFKTGTFSIVHSDQELLTKFKCRQSSMNEWIYEQDIRLKDVHGTPCYKLYNEFIAWAIDNKYQAHPSIFTFKEDMVGLYEVDISSSDIDGKKIASFYRRKQPSEKELEFNPFIRE